jgi:hypothetical protein
MYYGKKTFLQFKYLQCWLSRSHLTKLTLISVFNLIKLDPGRYVHTLTITLTYSVIANGLNLFCCGPYKMSLHLRPGALIPLNDNTALQLLECEVYYYHILNEN